jgi:hypothetical protein
MIDRQNFFQEIESAEKEFSSKGGSAWRQGIYEGFKTIRDLCPRLLDNIGQDIDQKMGKIEKALQIKETLEAWRGCGSCLGEEIEWFDGKCKVYDETEKILRRCTI